MICVQWSMVNFVCGGWSILSRQHGYVIRASESRAARREGSLPLSPTLRPMALCGVNCTACVKPLRGLELVSVSVSPTLTCGVFKMSPLRGLACWDYIPTRCCVICIPDGEVDASSASASPFAVVMVNGTNIVLFPRQR